MDLLGVSINAIVVAVVGGIVAWLGKGRFEAIDRRFEIIDRRFDSVDGRFDSVDRRFEAVDRRFEAVDRRFDSVERRFDRLESSLGALRSDLTQVALAVGVHPRAQNGGRNPRPDGPAHPATGRGRDRVPREPRPLRR